MTEEELIERRLAGASYEKLGQLAGLSESAVWKMLRGKVSAGRGKPSRLSESPRRSHSDLVREANVRAKAERNALGWIWAGVTRIQPTWRSWRAVFDVALRDSRGRLKPAVIAGLDRKAAATDKLIARRQTEHSLANTSTSDLTDPEYANAEASMVFCGQPNPGGWRSGASV